MRLKRKQKKDLFYFVVPLLLFQVNELIKMDVENPIMGYLLRCHFNDYLGGISFAAYLNVILSLSNWTSFQLSKVYHFLFAGLFCGICWEVITPIFIQTSTGDFWDVVAYILGMLTYWLVGVKLSSRDT